MRQLLGQPESIKTAGYSHGPSEVAECWTSHLCRSCLTDKRKTVGCNRAPRKEAGTSPPPGRTLSPLSLLRYRDHLCCMRYLQR